MKNKFNLSNYISKVIIENDFDDTVLKQKLNHNELTIFISAAKSRPKFIKMEWCAQSDADVFVLGDTWERSYGDLEFKRLSENDRYMPWYFIAAGNKKCFCFGVKTQPNSFVSFKYNGDKIEAIIDCRNGGCGVALNGRTIALCTFIYKQYESTDIFGCLQDFCKTMCNNPLLPNHPVYGGNNWYYAYGKSSYAEIISDARLQKEMAKGIENRPFMVVDDCWQINSCAGPWIPNEKFKDMKALADDIKALGVRPGIWFRPLYNLDCAVTDDMKILRNGEKTYMDPTNPKSAEYIVNDLKRIQSWGYELIKHDFSTFDLFGDWGKDLSFSITKIDNWHFYDETKTNAEIVLDFYRLIRNTCKNIMIIGCNTISHLCAGLIEINRTGDDTSGTDFDRTVQMGVNTLAFRLAQNNTFYMVDADCVGIIKGKIPWKKNRQWLDLLSLSNTALFAACNNTITENEKADISKAYLNIQKHNCIKPLDWMDNKTPAVWEIDGKKIEYKWNH